MKETVLVVGTANPDKLKELRRLLKGLRVQVRPVSDFGKVPKVVENGRTFAQNAEKKARVYSKITRSLTLADDSGLCVRALNGKPGVYSARFAGPGCTYEDNNRKLLKLLEGKPKSARRAYFISTIAVYDNGKRLNVVKGICHGTISGEARGKSGFGFDPVFVPRAHRKTFAQMTPAAKNKISHRRRALEKAKIFLSKHLMR